MLQMNKYVFLISFEYFYVFCFILILPKRTSGNHYQYDACAPVTCGRGPVIRFPFYVVGRQESYCGYPGFNLSCNDQGFPFIGLPENDYVIEEISYQNRILRVYNSAVSSLSSSSCVVPLIQNTTIPAPPIPAGRIGYFNATELHLFSICTNPLPRSLLRHRVFGCEDNIALYDDDEDLGNATETCERNVVASVERRQDDESLNRMGAVVEILRRGVMMNWTASDCSTCYGSGGRCGFNQTNLHFWCFCPDRPHSRRCRPPERNRNTSIILASAATGGFVFILCLVVLLIMWRRKRKGKNAYVISRNISSDPSSKSDIEAGSFYYGIPIFCYAELEEATNNFDPLKELGDGGFGTVYYGKLKDGREVAIKRLYENNYKRVEQFMNEIKILTCLKHRNLVTLYGCTSRRSRELLLVYEYIPNGTVADHLHGERAKESPLTWAVRMNIAIETASALAYLHKSDIVHRDVKTTNILLDSNFCVKVADFGLSRLFPTDVTHISTAPQGTPGYVDPEYHQCYQLTDKSDVYSFGVVLIELISSMPAVDISRHRHEINLANLAVNRIQRCAFDDLIDSSLGYKTDSEIFRMTTSVAELAFQCLQLEKDMRPSMDEVLHILKEIQNGTAFKSETSTSGKIPPSPETDDVELLKNKNLQASPTAVIDAWVSGSSTATTSSIS